MRKQQVKLNQITTEPQPTPPPPQLTVHRHVLEHVDVLPGVCWLVVLGLLHRLYKLGLRRGALLQRAALLRGRGGRLRGQVALLAAAGGRGRGHEG
jgi:hypothetical protein